MGGVSFRAHHATAATLGRPAIRAIEGVQDRDRLCPLYVNSGRPLSAKSSHSLTPWRRLKSDHNRGRSDGRQRGHSHPHSDGSQDYCRDRIVLNLAHVATACCSSGRTLPAEVLAKKIVYEPRDGSVVEAYWGQTPRRFACNIPRENIAVEELRIRPRASVRLANQLSRERRTRILFFGIHCAASMRSSFLFCAALQIAVVRSRRGDRVKSIVIVTGRPRFAAPKTKTSSPPRCPFTPSRPVPLTIPAVPCRPPSWSAARRA